MVVIAIIAILAALLLPALARAQEAARRASCSTGLAQIGKSIAQYTQEFGEYYPFATGPASGTAVYSYDVLTSLGNLYPAYLSATNVFRCASTENEPNATPNIPLGSTSIDGEPVTDDGGDANMVNEYAYSQRNWTLHDISYGYDCRISPKAPSNHAIMADMDGSYAYMRDTATQNHPLGQNVLYVDGKVKFEQGNSVSDEKSDNIFVENPWHADSDSFIWNGEADVLKVGLAGGIATVMDPADPSLSDSYDGYTDLHY